MMNFPELAPPPSELPVPRGDQLRLAVAAAPHVSGLRVFGSVARGEDRPDSDVDLLANLPPPA